MNLISGASSTSGPYGEIANTINGGIAFHGNVRCCYAPRETNLVADWLATTAMSFPFGTHVLSSPLGDCHNLLVIDRGEGMSSPPVEPSA